MSDITAKLSSDRLWATLGFFALLVANSRLNLGLSDDQLANAAYLTIAFVLGKSFRSSTPVGTAASVVLEQAGPLIGSVLAPKEKADQ
jgi:hypothetical protein